LIKRDIFGDSALNPFLRIFCFAFPTPTSTSITRGQFSGFSWRPELQIQSVLSAQACVLIARRI